MDITFTVNGNPVTQGSMTAFFNPSARKTVTRHDNGKDLTAWRENIRAAALRAVRAHNLPTPYDGPILVNVEFRLPQESKAARARTLPTHELDLDKLQRAVGDALSPKHGPGVLTNDARIIGWNARKIYGKPGATITLTFMNEKAPDD